MRSYRKFRPPTKKCAKCSKFKGLEDFSNSPKTKDGKRSSCIDCDREWLINWREKNKDNPPIYVESKKCGQCKEVKSREEFTLSHSSRDHLKSVCRSCSTDLHGEWARRRKSKDISRRYHLRGKYGLSEEVFKSKLEAQAGMCAICEQDMKGKACVDHCHNTGKLRDLLCNKCNSLLGALEKPEFMTKAVRYLIKHHPFMRFSILDAAGDYSQ